MKTKEVTERSKKYAEEIIKRDSGFLVPIYAVVKTDEKGRVMSVVHDHLNDVNVVKD